VLYHLSYISEEMTGLEPATTRSTVEVTLLYTTGKIADRGKNRRRGSPTDEEVTAACATRSISQ
jgi:hypothetical protein